MIVSKTPLRISFAGGGTDLPSFYKKNEYGAVLSTCIDSFLYVSVKKHTSLFNERIRLNYSESELVNSVDEIENSIIRESLKFLNIDDRIYISTVSDAPARSGLGSSSTFCVGLLNALYKFRGMSVSSGRLAEEAAHIEIDVLGRPIGKQDQYAAAFGGLNYFEFYSDDTVSVKPIHINNEIYSVLNKSMISFWTKETRDSGSVLKEQVQNHERNREMLLEMRQQADDLRRLLYNPNFNINSFSKIIFDGWELKRKLAVNVSNNSIDKAYKLALDNGALGGKISGAGGGGFLNIFSLVENQEKICDVLQNMGLVPYKFNFEVRGSMVINFD